MTVNRYLSCIFITCTIAMPVHGTIVYDAASEFLEAWTAKQNPIGTWTYGWAVDPGGPFTPYTRFNPSLPPQLVGMDDPLNHSLGQDLLIYFNKGPGNYFDTSVSNVPPGAIVLYGGGSSAYCGVNAGCVSEAVWTAPSTGLYDLNTTFTGRQVNVHAEVAVVYTSNGITSTLLLGFVGPQTSQSLVQTISIKAGDTLTFAVGYNGPSNGNTVQLAATLTSNDAVTTPEPSSIFLLTMGLSFIVCRERHAKPKNLRSR